jgi:hypothetical protein
LTADLWAWLVAGFTAVAAVVTFGTGLAEYEGGDLPAVALG